MTAEHARDVAARETRPGTIVAAPRGFADDDRFFRFSQVVVRAILHAKISKRRLFVRERSAAVAKAFNVLS